jgi:hypothetical protein
MANVRFLYANALSGASVVVTQSSQVVGLPGANVVQPDRSLAWQSTTTTADQWVAFDLGAAQVITAVAVASPKLHQGGTLKLQSSTDGSSWSDVGTFAAADADSGVSVQFVASVNARYWRLYFTNTTAVSDYVSVGYAFVGPYLEPARNVHRETSVALSDRSIVTESVTGQPSTTVRPQQTKGTFAFDFLSETDRANLQVMFRTQGYGLPIFAVLNTALSWTAWMIFLRSDLARTFSLVPNTYLMGFTWLEAL